MSAKFEAAKPGDIPFTLTVTLKLDEWQRVRARLQGDDQGENVVGYPLNSAISDMIHQAINIFYPNSKVFE